MEVVRYKASPVDQSLLDDCPPVSLAEVETNGDLLAAAIDANKRLNQCTADKQQLRGLLDGKD